MPNGLSVIAEVIIISVAIAALAGIYLLAKQLSLQTRNAESHRIVASSEFIRRAKDEQTTSAEEESVDERRQNTFKGLRGSVDPFRRYLPRATRDFVSRVLQAQYFDMVRSIGASREMRGEASPLKPRWQRLRKELTRKRSA